MKEFLLFVRMALMFIVVIWLIFAFAIGIKMVPNDDMYPRMDAGDIMMYYRIDKQVIAQDVIVLKKNDTEYVGRVVAVGGDTVEVTKERNLIINDNVVVENNIFYPTPLYEGFQEYPVKLAADECFVLVDQRDGGEDSRYYGPVKQTEIKGTVIGLYRRSSF